MNNVYLVSLEIFPIIDGDIVGSDQNRQHAFIVQSCASSCMDIAGQLSTLGLRSVEFVSQRAPFVLCSVVHHYGY
jgi:hypothetical protein